MAGCIALLTGINVGKAKRVSMSTLVSIFESLGFTDVRTLLNSGNVVFTTARPSPKKISREVEAALSDECGFDAAVTVVRASELSTVIDENPLLEIATKPSQHLVAFFKETRDLEKAKTLCSQDWKPDAFGIGSKAAYLWCERGVLKSDLMKEFARRTKGSATTRNWNTVLKLRDMVG